MSACSRSPEGLIGAWVQYPNEKEFAVGFPTAFLRREHNLAAFFAIYLQGGQS